MINTSCGYWTVKQRNAHNHLFHPKASAHTCEAGNLNFPKNTESSFMPLPSGWVSSGCDRAATSYQTRVHTPAGHGGGGKRPLRGTPCPCPGAGERQSERGSAMSRRMQGGGGRGGEARARHVGEGEGREQSGHWCLHPLRSQVKWGQEGRWFLGG